MSRNSQRYSDYDEDQDLKNQMFQKAVSNNWKARYPRKIRGSDLAWKVNILVGLHFLLLFLFCLQLQSIPGMILDSQERIVNIISGVREK